MRFSFAIAVLVGLGAILGSHAQFGGGGGFRGFFRGFGNGAGNFFRPMTHMFHHHVARPISNFMPHMPHFRMPSIFGGGNSHSNSGTDKPQATGIDSLYPEDCGRDPKKGTGLLCFPDGKLCADSTKPNL